MALKTIQTATRPWTPSETELRVAEYMACGYSQNRTAVLCDLDQTTISEWMRRPQFAELVSNMAAQFLNSGEAVHAQTIALCRLVVHQAVTGERDSHDPTVELAERVLAQTDWFQRRGEPRKQFGAT